ncbi:dynactin 6 [Schistosoma bovis]|nr:dynactin 6 [Schistosoma bovis]
MKPASGFTSFRSQVRITPGAVVCSECELSGEIIIGANTIIHPKARIIAEAGPIHIGSFNLIEEQVEIVNRIPGSIMKIGDYNVFEVGAHCYALEVGDNNVFEAKCHIGSNVKITHGCVIGAMCSMDSGETLPECTVVYSDEVTAQTLQLDFLTKILPNYHHLMKASRTSTPKPTEKQ